MERLYFHHNTTKNFVKWINSIFVYDCVIYLFEELTKLSAIYCRAEAKEAMDFIPQWT